MSNLLKLLLVEDDVLFRLGLATCLQREPSIELVVEASDGESAILLCGEANANDLAQKQAFDVVILDLGLPGLGGIETCRNFTNFIPNYPF